MLGLRIGAWAGLPIEGCLCLDIGYLRNSNVFEIVKLWQASENLPNMRVSGTLRIALTGKCREDITVRSLLFRTHLCPST